jgi:hypothetical protein
MNSKQILNWLSEQKRIWGSQCTKTNVKGFEALSNPDIIEEAKKKGKSSPSSGAGFGYIDSNALTQFASHFARELGHELSAKNAELLTRLSAGKPDSEGSGAAGIIPVSTTGERLLDPTVVDTTSSAGLGKDTISRVRKSSKPMDGTEKLKDTLKKLLRSKNL